MKLIDLLVQELPRRGGWPEGVNFFTQDGPHSADPCEINGFKTKPKLTDRSSSSYWSTISEGSTGYGVIRIKSAIISSDYMESLVTREQYEAALAASQQPVWDGEGLPPIGCECMVLCDTGTGEWLKGRIIAHDNSRVVGRWLEGKAIDSLFDYRGSSGFRPIQSEVERKREETILDLLQNVTNYNKTDVIFAVTEIYDAIAAGQIRGIMLTEGED